MPSVSVTIPDVDQSVSRPVILKVLNQVFEITGLSKNTKILFPGAVNSVYTPGTNVEDRGDNTAVFGSDRLTFIEVSETPNLDSLQETQTHSLANPPVFYDPHLQFSAHPIYITTDVVMTIRYRSNSKTEVERWMADMYIRTSRGRDINLHDFTYRYSLPQELITLIEIVHERREKVAPYGQTLDEYFKFHATDRFTLVSNQAGEALTLSVSEKANRIQGMFDFVGVPDSPTRDADTGTWELSFTYKFSYQQPRSMYIRYPVMVHNQLLPPEYTRDLYNVVDYEQHPQTYDKFWKSMSFFESDKNAHRTRKENPYFRIPFFDDFRLNAVASYTGTVFTALCEVESDQRTLLNLNELGDLVLDPDVLEFIIAEASFVNRIYLSFVHLSLYRDEYLVSDNQLELTPEGLVRATQPLDLRRQHRVRLSLMPKLSSVNQAAIDRLLSFPRAFVKILGAMNEVLLINPDFVDLGNRNKIEEYEFRPIFRLIVGLELDIKQVGIQNVLPNLGHSPDSIPVFGTTTNANRFPGRPHRRRPPSTPVRKEFLRDIDPKILQEYFRWKRNTYTVMNAGILVYPRSHNSYADSYLLQYQPNAVRA